MWRVFEPVRVGPGKQAFVIGEFGRHRGAGKRKHNDLFKAVQMGELPVKRQQYVVDHQEPVLCVARDPTDLVR